MRNHHTVEELYAYSCDCNGDKITGDEGERHAPLREKEGGRASLQILLEGRPRTRHRRFIDEGSPLHLRVEL